MEDHSSYIMDYLSGNLSPGEKKQFEDRLARDEELRRQYEVWARGVEYIKAKSALEEIENDPDLPEAEAMVEEWLSKEHAGKKTRKEAGKSQRRLSTAHRRRICKIPVVGILQAKGIYS